ncbi:lipolytic enzyme, GDSL family [Legionella steelei]|uniref:Lipolytic enzyme, GDSL family n=1 Tax=Legionella steelei TaxID=947033 RepID=A0A0W0ZE18_9GAMM|nr:SGNH/GDSL hydrolase family protein [Legionella steelei]KTD67304.1 lipolytic enzyme, GDSL family [Legionella steelei]
MTTSKKERKPISPSQPQKEISYFVVFGDSLSDGKNMGEKASFLGPLARKLWLAITGLDKSPKERFTNGYTWADSLKSTLISKFLNEDKIKEDSARRNHNLNNADIGDDILSRSSEKQYTEDEIRAEIRRVRRKKRVAAREEGHLFTSGLENTPKTDPLPRHQPQKTHRVTAIKKAGLPKATLRESSDDIADQLITDPRYSKYVREYYSLDDGRIAQYNGRNFYRNYSQGGSTSYDYSWNSIFLSLLSPFTSIKLFFTRLMVSNLSKQVVQFLEDNEKEEISTEQKKKTLITVFSGANDLITVNSEPTEEAAELAAQSNIDNIESLIKQGYSNFVLCNLPDLSLTPRYQHKSDEERKNAQKISKEFNKKLAEKLKILKDANPECSIELFDIETVFTKIYDDVRDNGEHSKYAQYFDPKALKEPYLEYAKAHNIPTTPGGVAPGKKHMFWDDVHPTETMHALLMSEYYKNNLSQYKISAPAEQSPEYLCKIFNRKYHEKIDELTFGPLSFCSELRINYKEPEKALISILRYALNEESNDGDCLRDAMTDLGWWVNDKPNMCIPALADAMWILNPIDAQKLDAELDPHLAETSSHKMMLGALSGEPVGKKPQFKRITADLALDPVVVERLKKLEKKPGITEPETTVLKKQEPVTEPLTLSVF